MSQRVDINGVGIVNFPDDYTPEKIKFAIENDILPRAKGGDEAPFTDRLTATGKELGRQAGLAGRYLVESAAGLAAPINQLFGLKPVGAALTSLGVPEPETPTERLVGDISRGIAGAGLGVGAASQVAGPISRVLAANPAAQALGGGAAGGASGLARESGVGELGQLAAGLAGGFAGSATLGTLGEVAKAGGRSLSQTLAPFTQGGREQIVGNTLQRLAVDPLAARASLADIPEFIPGSQPTTAQAAADTGLLQAERALASTSPLFAARKSSNIAARNRILEDIAQTPEALEAAKVARGTEGNIGYEKAFTTPLDPAAPVDPLLELAKRPSFQAAVKKAATLAAENGEDVGNVLTSTKGLHYVKLALDDTLDTAPTSGIGKTQRRAIAETRSKLLDWLDTASPAYAEARAKFREASRPIAQMEEGQRIQGATRLAGPDVTGEPILSQAKWQNVVTRNLAKLGKTMSPEQVDNLMAIGADLDRASLSDTAGRATGSNTFQNLSTANVIGAALGGKLADNAVAQSLMRPLAWVYKLPEAQVQELFSQAMLDPSIARALIAKARPSNVDFLAAALKDKARALGIGVAMGEATQQ